jgi:AcrR family transcriptional regulator
MPRESTTLSDESLWLDVTPASSRRMLSAAVEAFAERGYHATTTREIANKAGMSPAAVYTHYRSKADLLFAISEAGHQAVLRDVEHALADVDTPGGRLHRMVSAMVSWNASNHTLARIVSYELSGLEHEQFEQIRTLRDRLEAIVHTELKHGAQTGHFDIADEDTTAMAIMSLAVDVARWYRPGDLAPEALGAKYAGLALRMVSLRVG